MKIVTVGTGMAAAEFVQNLRQGGFAGEIVMISDEPYAPYSPCIIPFFLAGEPLADVFWKGEDFYNRYGVTTRLSEKVVEVDAERRQVRTESGRVEGYDRLFFAAGARSWFPRPEWLETEGVHGFKSLSDMLDIDRQIREEACSRAVVFGGGFIGTDAALALWHRGLQVTLVHRNNRLLSQMTDVEGGQFATRKLAEKTSLDIRLGTEVAGIERRDGRLAGVQLTDGTRIETSLLIIATGVTPNSGPLTGDDRGVSATQDLLADPLIYVAGDVALTRHAVDGRPGLYAMAPNAVEQARTAARQVLGEPVLFSGSVNTNVLRKHLDFPVLSVGRFEGEAVTFERGDLFRRVYLREGRINGYILVGDTRLCGYLYDLYRAQTLIGRDIGPLLADTRGDWYYRSVMGLAGAIG
ncbi:MAG: FAD-dependent oxidoreductase [Syntrophotaleaceae bacterium]